MVRRKTIAKTLALVATAATLLAACGSQGGTTAPAKPTAITFWGWAAGYDKSVALWNTSHPDVQIKYESITNGGAGGYDKLLTAAKAGTAPCLAQIGYETLPSFLSAGVLQNVADHAKADQGEFDSWVWNKVALGNEVYGIPVDTAPMATFYRADLFKRAGIAIPKTWDEFAAAAKAVKAYDPKASIMNLPTDAYLYAGFAWQNDATWFGTAGDKWSVSMDSAANKKVADYWQGLYDQKLVTGYPAFDASLYSAWSSGQVWSEVGPVWSASLIRDNAGGSAGKWAVAPMPTWPDSHAVGNSGGSATVVTKDCKNPKEATEFAAWMSTDDGSVSNLIKSAAILPASHSGLKNAALSAPESYYGGQKIYELFRDEAAKVGTNWQWGPVMNTTAAALGDGLGKVTSGGSTIDQALVTAGKQSVDQLKSQGFSVASN
jgi:multiple sugar transport system substrate-binding protein